METLPILPLRDVIVFPGALVPVLLGRGQSLSGLNSALSGDGRFLAVLQKDPEVETVTEEHLYNRGVVCNIVSTSPLQGNMVKVMLQGDSIVHVHEITSSSEKILLGRCSEVEYPKLPFSQERALTASLVGAFQKYAPSQPDLPETIIDSAEKQLSLFDTLKAIVPFANADLLNQQSILNSVSIEEMTQVLLEILKIHTEVFVLNRKLEQDIRHRVQKQQRDYLIQEQMRRLGDELEDVHPEVHPELVEMKERMDALDLPPAFKEKLEKEISRMGLIQPGSPEYTVSRTYIDTCLALPFGQYSTDTIAIPKLKKALNSKHFGLEKVKERIIEHAAVLARGPREQAPVLCLIGPPGVGKTTLARSIATALGREYIRISLGGVRDESEIRGHRRTYIGAMPGRIIEALRKSKKMNPFILLDEIDKMSSDLRGDPAAALLEVLDPEQNSEYQDHYLETGIDLSRVLFFTTANSEEGIPAPLRDRMEIVRLPGYHSHEKLEITKRHLLPKVCEKNGILEGELECSEELLQSLIKGYTREAGVRLLEQTLDKVARKRTLEVLTKKKIKAELSEKDIVKYLGAAPFVKPLLPEKLRPGTALGLAYSPGGGSVLFIEVTLLDGKGRLKLTGSLGDVMKESAAIAITLLKERAHLYGLTAEIFQKTDVHIHFPEGAIPKDGPSAGIGLTCALFSAFLRKPIPAKYAFTGEVSLSGVTHAIGGLPEKSLAALESGVQEILIPLENKRNIAELPAPVRKGLKISTYDHIDKVLRKVFAGKGKSK